MISITPFAKQQLQAAKRNTRDGCQCKPCACKNCSC